MTFDRSSERSGAIQSLNKSPVRGNEVILAGLDIGSTKVAMIIGVVRPRAGASGTSSSELSSSATLQMISGLSDDYQVEVIGLGECESDGIRQGVVVNVEATLEAIQRAREEAELMAGIEVREVLVAVGGSHVKSFDSRGMIAVRNKEVRPDDIARVIEAAKAVAVPADRTVLHVLPREFQIDEQAGITDPIGMSGIRLEASVHIITAGQTALQNILKCAEKAGLAVKGLVLQQFASALAVLSEDERKLGVSLIDMGGGTSDIMTFISGAAAHTATVPVGGAHFTQDIAMGLRTPQASAEEMKHRYGCAVAEIVDEAETIEVEGVGGRKPRALLRRDLCEVIEPRAEETLLLIWQEIRRSGLANQIGSGLVLTGGASLLEGLVEMGEFICEVPVRRGVPQGIGGLVDVVRSPAYATAVGLLKYGVQNLTPIERQRLSQGIRESDYAVVSEAIENVAKKVKSFFSGAAR